MPVSVSFEEPSRLLVHASGKVVFQETIVAIEAMMAHPRTGPGTTILVDAREVTAAPQTEELREIANAFRPLMRRGIRGFAIVTSTAFVYGVARMFAVLAELVDVKVDVYRDMEEARRSLA